MPPLTENEFHDLEENERRAVLAGDAVAIERFWSPELLVNGPHNRLLIGRMLKMKATSALAIGVCLVCFFIGYLFFVAVTMFVDFFKGRIDPCRDTVELCSQRVELPRSN